MTMFGGGFGRGFGGGGFGSGSGFKDPTRILTDKVTETIVKEVVKHVVADDNPIKRILTSEVGKYTEPPAGTVIYCKLGPVEHSGVYVGNRKVVELQGSGNITTVTLDKFTGNVTTIVADIRRPIFVPFDSDSDLGTLPTVCGGYVADRASRKAGMKRDYNFVLDNCHQFCSGCITGDFDNSDNFLWMLEDTIENRMNASCDIKWLPWDWQNGVVRYI